VDLLVDECVNRKLISALRKLGHDVQSIKESAPSLKDGAILAKGLIERRVVITDDYDFGDLIFRDGQPAYSVVIFAPEMLDQASEEFATETALRLTVLEKELPGHFVNMDRLRHRLRSLP
jgi:predicted nuclease of predicted toxin-antitoxin system